MVDFGFLKFEETYMERIWGGTQLRRVLGKQVPGDKVIGESWVVSDHEICQSVVCEGPFAGQSLHALMEQDPAGLLGVKGAVTPDGRFPLLLKIIDAEQDLSVQVHPDDEQARALGEPDAGKTEMWYMMGTEGACDITLGVRPGASRAELERRLREGGAEDLLCRFPVAGGEAVFVAAGSVHAIGGGALLAEIQQNSNITYRLYDYKRTDKDGNPRELHLDKGLTVARLDAGGGGRMAPLRYTVDGARREFLSACRYFAAEKVFAPDGWEQASPQDSFHILLALEGGLTLEADGGVCRLARGEAALAPASMSAWRVSGPGPFLDYYVPDLLEDVVHPLRRHGYADSQILLLAGASGNNDLEPVLAGSPIT